MKTRSFLATALAAVIAAGLTPAVHAQPATDFVTVSGSATYLQRIALPPEAVLTVRIEDISSAGNNAQVLAETREPSASARRHWPTRCRCPAPPLIRNKVIPFGPPSPWVQSCGLPPHACTRR